MTDDWQALREALEYVLKASLDGVPRRIWAAKAEGALLDFDTEPGALTLDRLADAIDHHGHAIGWDRMCSGEACAAKMLEALRWRCPNDD